MVCDQCWLVQTLDYKQANELFDAEYAYFSSTSRDWLKHAHEYVERVTEDLKINKKKFVVEVASNDGYLLKNFVKKNVPCLGIEPTDSTADVAEAAGIPVLREFFGEHMAQRLTETHGRADLIIGNNVYAHVPDINDFTRGLKALLKLDGTITLEFPHVMRLLEFNQFDTIYHEHFSYLSLYTVISIFKSAGLRVWKAEELPTHGGSLRVYGVHEADQRKTTPSVGVILNQEKERGLQRISTYQNFQLNADAVKNEFLNFLITQKKLGKKVVGYGAAAKGSTLLNYAGVKPDLLTFICDGASSKQGRFMPGSHIPIVTPEALQKQVADYVVIFPWNIADEITGQISGHLNKQAKFVTFIPFMREDDCE
jgi:hypothetical protein